MIPSLLEKLILSGKAEFKTYAMGGSAMGTIVVPTNNLCVVVGFIWHGFNDADIFSVDQATTRNIDSGIHTMRLKSTSGGKVNLFNFRDSFVTNKDLDTNINYAVFPAGQFYPAYITSQDDIQIDIWKLKGDTMNFGFAAVNPEVGEQNPPRGYNGLQVNQQTQTDGGGVINNIGGSRNTNLGGIPQIRNEFFGQINVLAALSDPTGYSVLTYAFPLVTFQYVLINELSQNWL